MYWFLTAYVVIAAVVWTYSDGLYLAPLIVLMFGVLGASMVWLLARVHDLDTARQHDYRQVEALVSLVPLLGGSTPLPPMRNWAASPDYLAILAREIISNKPGLIVELGSGVSTQVAALCLRKNQFGMIVSIEQDPGFAEVTRRRLAAENLGDIAEVIDAPLTELHPGEESFRWYDTAKLDHLRGVDMLIIDGPSVKGQKQYLRYPALPFFAGRGNKGMVIVLDDAARPDERRCIERWQKEFPALEGKFVEAEKGAWVGRM
jgi:predicted O-methyltransferase YrrM